MADAPKCPACPRPLPLWLVTFSDLMSLLLTFFVLLLSFAKTETAKSQAAFGSIRDSFGGASLQRGEVPEFGKSPDGKPIMMESQDIIKPFPIEYLSTSGFFNKYETNRESDENLKKMREDLENYDLSEATNLYEVPEGVFAKLKDRIYFEKGSIKISVSNKLTINQIVKLISQTDWILFIEGHASSGEISSDKKYDALMLSSYRAASVAKEFIRLGVNPEKITTVFYGDTRPYEDTSKSSKELIELSRRVEFIIRKRDLSEKKSEIPIR
jgi:chemotaxis protein MotB